MEDSIKNLLRNVTKVPKCGIPGTLVVFDSNAYPILTGDDTNSVVFAAAEVGLGRIFVTSHELYIENFLNNTLELETLWNNIKTWLTKGKVVNDYDIKSVASYESVMDIPEDVKLIKWIGTENKTELFINQFLKKFITTGGSLICGVCPWGWLNSSHSKYLEDCSLNKFLSSCGICFSADVCKLEANYFSVRNNITLNSHLGNAINLLSTNMFEARNVQNLIINGINALPTSIAGKHLERLHKILYSYICSKYKPTSKTSVSCPIGTSLLAMCCHVYQKFSSCGIRVKAANIEEFPGNFSNLASPKTTTTIVSVRSKYDEFHCTGYYIAAGSSVRVTVLDGFNSNGWEIRVGAHTDDLSNVRPLHRWPQVTSAVKLKKSLNLTSAFGGLIYLDSPKGNSTIRVKLENVIEAPFIDITKPETITNWTNSSKAPGLWAELCGRHIAFTVPSKAIRNLENPEEILKMWDMIVMANHELRGTDPFNTWRERIVIDIQPLNGFHSGYPITIPLDHAKNQYNNEIYLFDKVEVSKKGWVILHELAHNIQRACWTPSGAEEITVDIFTLHAFNIVFKEKIGFSENRFLKQKLNEKVLDVLKTRAYTFDDWCSNSSIGIFLYAQLINSFGWNALKILFREYEGLSDKEKIFKSNSDKWDQFICRFSNIVGLDVSPLFYFWCIPFSRKPSTNLSDLIPWLPDDEITQKYPDRVNYVKLVYNNLLLGNESHHSICSQN